jgi:RNA polymerase sigma-70 factor (ECF subfamily)
VLPWIYRVATNHCLNQRRNTTRRGEDYDPPPLELAASTDEESLPNRQLVQGILSRFDATTQTVAVGVLVDGMEQEEVAVVLGLSRRTVARKLARFLDLARHHVDRS